MRNKDDLQAQYLLEQAEAAAWLVEARERSRLLLEINARRADLAGKRAREAIAQSESAQQAARAAADQLETKPPTPEAKPTPPDMVVTLFDLLFKWGGTLHAEAHRDRRPPNSWQATAAQGLVEGSPQHRS